MAADLSAAVGAAAVGNEKHRSLTLTTTTEKEYDSARDEFVKRMMRLQHELASWEGIPAVDGNKTARWKDVANEGGGIGGGGI